MRTEPLAKALRTTKRDHRAFEAFYSEHIDALLSYMLRRVYDLDTALDLTAETFAQAYLGAGGFRGSTDAEAKAWLYGIGSRQLAQFVRRKKVERKALRMLGMMPPQLAPDEQALVIERAGLAQLRLSLNGHLESLSAEQRDAIRLRVVDELSYAEVSNELGISEEAARARVARGLKTLAERVAVLEPALKEELS